MYRARTSRSTLPLSSFSCSVSATVLLPLSTGTWKKGIPNCRTSSLEVGVVGHHHRYAHLRSPRRWRHSRSSRQWSALDTKMATRFVRRASTSRKSSPSSRHRSRRPPATRRARHSAGGRRCAGRTARRTDRSTTGRARRCWPVLAQHARHARHDPGAVRTQHDEAPEVVRLGHARPPASATDDSSSRRHFSVSASSLNVKMCSPWTLLVVRVDRAAEPLGQPGGVVAAGHAGTATAGRAACAGTAPTGPARGPPRSVPASAGSPVPARRPGPAGRPRRRRCARPTRSSSWRRSRSG